MKKHKKKIWKWRYVKCLTPNFGPWHPDHESIEFRGRKKFASKEECLTAVKKRFPDEWGSVTIFSEWV